MEHPRRALVEVLFAFLHLWLPRLTLRGASGSRAPFSAPLDRARYFVLFDYHTRTNGNRTFLAFLRPGLATQGGSPDQNRLGLELRLAALPFLGL